MYFINLLKSSSYDLKEITVNVQWFLKISCSPTDIETTKSFSRYMVYLYSVQLYQSKIQKFAPVACLQVYLKKE